MKRILCLTLLILLCHPGTLHAAKRVALVIGNAKYADAPLANPVNDATDMASKLKKLGFDVTLLKNASGKSMSRGIRDFRAKLPQAKIRLFYYAGHGMQVGGVNYLLPVDADIRFEDEVKHESISAGRVLDTMAAAGLGVNVVILDACRNNPFSRSFRSANKGLARMDAPSGSMLVYATSPGDVAADGRGRNGVFTGQLLKNLDQQGLTLEQVFKRTGKGVMRATKGSQMPWSSSSLYDDVYLAGTPSGQQLAMAPAPDQAPGETVEEGAIQEIKTSRHAPGDTWTEPTTGMKFVWVPGGCFDMGSETGKEDERPVHEVCLDGFWMGKYEVTLGQFKQFKPSHTGRQWYSRTPKGGNNHPAIDVYWKEAKAYADWMSSKGNGTFRMPSEAQWEYAARAGSPVTPHLTNPGLGACREGNIADLADRRAALKQYSVEESRFAHIAYFKCNDGFAESAPVGSFLPNAFGLHDMFGNVSELCEDVYHESAYKEHSRFNPLQTTGSKFHVSRGLSWGGVEPTYSFATRSKGTAAIGTGFRLIRIEE